MNECNDLTVFVLTIGDQVNFLECLDRLKQQSVAYRLEVISGVAPMPAALQEMINRCTTKYFVQVDEDMLLVPHAVANLYYSLMRATETTAIVCAPLWDCYMSCAIHGVKIYRHDIVRHFPYEDTLSCEWHQVKALQASGYKVSILPLCDKNECWGEHGKHYTEESIFVRFRGLFWKHRRYQHMRWLEPWPLRLMERYLRSRTPIDLYALLGAIAGLTGSGPPDWEKDYRERCEDFERLKQYFGEGITCSFGEASHS